jgi:hypothetical protein
MPSQLHFFVGSLFSLTGLVLLGYGLLSDPAIYARSLGWNVNLWWGLVLALFGGAFLGLWRTSRGR